MFDSIHEECGVFGIREKTATDVATDAYYALFALQHRGQESCGIAVNHQGIIISRRDVGLVQDVFDHASLQKLGQGTMAVGHVRYGAAGQSSWVNAQPLVIQHIKGPMALANNGSLTNAYELREKLELDGAIFQSNSDSEVIAYTLTKARLTASSIEAAVEAAMYELQGAYSIVMMSASKLIAFRDPHGFRPLCMGRSRTGGVIFASESCALDSLGAAFVRDIKPGEIVVADENGVRSITTHCQGKGHFCVFEFVYFARPDSVIEGVSVHEARKRAGAYLALEHPVQADVVIGVPDSGLDAALGYAHQSGIPYGVGFIKNRYIGRTFIQPSQGQREDSVRIKLNALSSTVNGKRVVMVDDSIVRGTTSRHIVRLLREAGAKEVHMMVSSPPFLNPCYFGTDIDSKDKLIACRMSESEIAKMIGVDSLGYLTLDNIKHIAGDASCGFCTACFDGLYPVQPAPRRENRFDQPRQSKG